MSNKKIGQDFAFKLKYLNPLPEQPFEAKLLEYPFAPDREYRYNNTSLYENTPVTVHSSTTCLLNFLEMGLFEQSSFDQVKNLLDGDQALLVGPSLVSSSMDSKKLKKVASAPRPIVPWLRRTEYISSEGRNIESTNKKDSNQQQFNQQQHRTSQDMTLESLIDRITGSFEYEENLDKLVHPTNKKLKAVETIACFPDFECWPNDYSHALFDSNPVGSNDFQNTDLQEAQSQEALLKAMINPRTRQQFISYYVPNQTSIEKMLQIRETGQEDHETYQYDHVRDFDLETKLDDLNKTMIMVIKDKEAAYYHFLSGKILMKRARAKSKNHQDAADHQVEKPMRLLLTKRPFSADEKIERDLKVRRIAPLDE